MKKNNILTFLVILLAVNLIFSLFFRGPDQNDVKPGDIGMTLSKNAYDLHDQVNVDIKNNTDQTLRLKNECPGEPLDVFHYSNGTWTQIKTIAPISCYGTTETVIQPQSKVTISYPFWNNALFHETGRYKIAADLLIDSSVATQKPTTPSTSTVSPAPNAATPLPSSSQKPATFANPSSTPSTSSTAPTSLTAPPNSTATLASKHVESPEFQINPQGWFSYLWTILFYQPLFNILILLLNIMPGKDLGLAIIVLTILIRTVLLVPSQNALKSQRKLQEIQPKLAKIKELHKDNKEMEAMETMKIWKEHKVNPLGSCLPMLIQIPVLIALYYVIRSGLNPDNVYLLYPQLKDFVFENIHTNFLNILDLTKANVFVLPLIVGGLQFLQMKLALVRTAQKQSEKQLAKPSSDKKEKKTAPTEMEMANKMMVYFMPLMIALVTISVPAGAGLYWAVSTIYGIFQQLVVNRQSNRDKVKVKVLS